MHEVIQFAPYLANRQVSRLHPSVGRVLQSAIMGDMADEYRSGGMNPGTETEDALDCLRQWYGLSELAVQQLLTQCENNMSDPGFNWMNYGK